MSAGTLGEYYTPRWLARSIVHEIVDKPLEQRASWPTSSRRAFIGGSHG